jgi:betaine-homocysteine S-methyltransferase
MPEPGASLSDKVGPMTATPAKRGLLERLSEGPVICAEGYLFELERRGYLQAGSFVPEVVLEHPEALAQVHRELMRAGSDVIEAFTYYGHREKLRLIGKEDALEPLNLGALELAHSVAAEATGEPPLVAGNICNTNVWHANDDATARTVRAMFEEQVAWAVEGKADYVIAETFYHCEEARVALDVIKQSGLPSVVTLALPASGTFVDGYSAGDAAAVLADEGADVVGLNCFRGPDTTMPALREMRARVSTHVAALPVPYRTTEEFPTFFTFADDGSRIPNGRPFPVALDSFLCDRYEMADFARAAFAADVRYVGVCCGGGPHHVRAMAEALGRTPPASAYSPDMSKHFAFGTDPSLDEQTRGLASSL